MSDPICKNCGESIWLHPELDYDGLIGNGCTKYEVNMSEQNNDAAREVALESALENELVGVMDKRLAWNIGYDACLAALADQPADSELCECGHPYGSHFESYGDPSPDAETGCGDSDHCSCSAYEPAPQPAQSVDGVPTIEEMSGSIDFGGRVVFVEGERFVIPIAVYDAICKSERSRIATTKPSQPEGRDAVIEAARKFRHAITPDGFREAQRMADFHVAMQTQDIAKAYRERYEK